MVDLEMTTEGELVIGSTGDLTAVYGDQQLAQEVLFRLKTTIGDWILSPEIGASLEDFIGQPNTEIIHRVIQTRIKTALQLNNLLFFPDVKVFAINKNEILCLVEFVSYEDDDRIIQVQAGFDVKKGLVYSRTDSRIRI